MSPSILQQNMAGWILVYKCRDIASLEYLGIHDQFWFSFKLTWVEKDDKLRKGFQSELDKCTSDFF